MVIILYEDCLSRGGLFTLFASSASALSVTWEEGEGRGGEGRREKGEGRGWRERGREGGRGRGEKREKREENRVRKLRGGNQTNAWGSDMMTNAEIVNRRRLNELQERMQKRDNWMKMHASLSLVI